MDLRVKPRFKLCEDSAWFSSMHTVGIQLMLGNKWIDELINITYLNVIVCLLFLRKNRSCPFPYWASHLKYFLIFILVWPPPEADPKTRIQRQVA